MKRLEGLARELDSLIRVSRRVGRTTAIWTRVRRATFDRRDVRAYLRRRGRRKRRIRIRRGPPKRPRRRANAGLRNDLVNERGCLLTRRERRIAPARSRLEIPRAVFGADRSRVANSPCPRPVRRGSSRSRPRRAEFALSARGERAREGEHERRFSSHFDYARSTVSTSQRLRVL